MLSITERRRERFCRSVLTGTSALIGLADIGSGGPLKKPWRVLPPTQLRKFDFEPTQGDGALPLCVSNRTGRAQFFVARDERASSFHRPVSAFAERFGRQSHLPVRTIEVERTTLDSHFEGRYDLVDAIDVNVEGHDYQVLQGGARLLDRGVVKLLKVEFELAAVWEEQGWFSDIDPLMRGHGYVLGGIAIDHARPAKVQHCFHRGEPLWGKALYVPGPNRWRSLLERLGNDSSSLAQAVAKGAALYVAADLPGQALDIVELGARGGAEGGVLEPTRVKRQIEQIYRWARVEYGTHEVLRLVRRAVGLKGGDSEP